jgi:hypothetical protein
MISHTILIDWNSLLTQSIFWLFFCVSVRWVLNNMEVLENGNVGGAKDGEQVLFGNLGRFGGK